MNVFAYANDVHYSSSSVSRHHERAREHASLRQPLFVYRVIYRALAFLASDMPTTDHLGELCDKVL
jgi:hypothetical protein